jgi:hypothetical protein
VVADYNRALDDLVAIAARDVGNLWALTPDDARAVVAMLIAGAPEIAHTYGTVAATLGADLYADLRAAGKAHGKFRPVPADTAPVGQVEALARWAVSPLFDAEPDDAMALGLFAAGMERLVLQPFRRSVVENTGADKAALGVVRIASPGACPFCSELANEVMFVSPSGESDADQWHRSCRCTPAPAF